MPQEIDVHYVQQFTDMVLLLQQQMGSRLRESVMVDSTVVGDRTFYNQLDSIGSMDLVANRHGETEYSEAPHLRRMVTLQPFDKSVLVDRADQRRLLADPTNDYSRAIAAAASRKLDELLFTAFDATAATGVDGSTTVAFDSAFSFSEASATNFGHEDLIKGRRLLEAAENMEDDGDHSWHIACSANQRENLLNDSVIQSIDTNTVRALVNGQIDTYMGFHFIKSQMAAITGANIRDVFMWVKASMKLAISQEPRGFIDVLPGRRHSTQIRFELDAGAIRMDEKGVVRCLADES